MAAQKLQPSDIAGRRIDILGEIPNVDITAGGQTYLFFTTGNVGYPAPSSRTYVAYITVEPAGSLAALSAGHCLFSAGGVTSIDWTLYSIDLAPAYNGFDPPYVFSPTMELQSSALYNPPVYTSGQLFRLNISTVSPPANLPRCTFTAYGWAS